MEAAPVAAAPVAEAPALAGPGPSGSPARLARSLARLDPGTRARFALGLQRGHGNAYVQKLARVELGPSNTALPTDIGQEYTVNSELEEMLARVARGELNAAEAEAQMAQTAAAEQAAVEGAAEQTAGRTAIQMGARALLNIVTSGAAMTGVFGAFVTIAATLASLEEGAEARRVGDAIVAATDGYVAGFMSGVGWTMQGGDAAWFADARTKGAAAKAALVARCRESPALKNFAIGPDEVMLAILDRKDALHAELYKAVKPRIGKAYLDSWRAGLGWMTKTFTNEEESGERRIRTRAGLPLSA